MTEIELEIGSPAPDFRLPAHSGGEIALSDYRGQEVVLFFVREFIWMQCRSHVAQLGRMNAELVKAGVQVLVILGDTQERAREYAESTRAPFPILSDPERAIYHLYGLERGIFRLQRTASIIVDQDGLIRYLKRVTNPMTWLKESQDLLREVKRQ